VQPSAQANVLAGSHGVPSSSTDAGTAAQSNLVGSEPGWSFVRSTPSPDEPAEETSRDEDPAARTVDGGTQPAGEDEESMARAGGRGEESRDKGKGRAVTVEDGEDADG